jgi:hypothetical protein
MYNFSQRNVNTFIRLLSQVTWDDVISCSNPDDGYNKFLELFLPLYYRCFQSIPSAKINRNFIKPWMTAGLYASMVNRSRLYKGYLNGSVDRTTYVKYKNNLTKLLRIRKQNYYNEFFKMNRKNGIAIWKMISSTVNSNASSNEITTDVNKLNDFFADLGCSTTKHLPFSGKNSYLNNVRPNAKSFILNETNWIEVLTTGLSLNSKKSSGYDGVSSWLMKLILHVILVPLTHIFNMSFRYGIVPRKLKIAKVIPVFKTGDKSLPVNYRPISLLPAFSKLLEKLMYNRMIAYINRYNILSTSQYGFRSNMGTTDAVYNLANYITENLDSGVNILGLFIDVSKAFDSLPHYILLDKLYHYGFRGISSTWFGSYLSERYQFTYTANGSSLFRSVKTGIPQGSILGPILFLLYINDLPNISKTSRFILFADDTTCLMPCKHSPDNTLLIDAECEIITEWFIANRLALNVVKCKSIYFSLNRCAVFRNVYLNGQVVDRVNTVKFLGCCIDSQMNWHDHINEVSLKITKGVAMLRFVNGLFPIYIKRMIYFAYLYPHMVYCLPAWGGSHITYTNRVLLLQKRALRLLSGAPFLAHSELLAYQNKLLLFHDIYRVCMFRLIHSIYYTASRTKYNMQNDLFVRKEVNFNLRNSVLNFPTHYVRTVCRKQSVFISGINIWNAMPEEIKSEHVVVKCMRKLFNYLLLNYQY